MGKLPASHRYNRLPLLPSDPGGFQQELVAQDLPGAKVEKFNLQPNKKLRPRNFRYFPFTNTANNKYNNLSTSIKNETIHKKIELYLSNCYLKNKLSWKKNQHQFGNQLSQQEFIWQLP